MAKSNKVIANEVLEKKELWGPLRKALPVQEIRRIMRSKNILNKDLAERLGVTEASVSRMLKGQQNLQLETLYQLADAIEEKLEVRIGSSIQGDVKSSAESTKTTVDFFTSDINKIVDMNKYRANRAGTQNVSRISASFQERAC